MPETTTLPIPPAVAAVLALLVLTWALFGLLLLLGRDRPAPRWEGMSPGWQALAVVGALVWIALFLMILAAVFNGLIGAMEAPEATSLGLGGLLVALLGAPFLIWSTWLKHRTVEFQKEGHMTDRIAKAVEQLGAEKTVDRIGRPVTVAKGDPDELEGGEQLETKTLIEWQGTPLSLDEGWWVQTPGKWKVFSESVPNLEVRIGAILSLERIAQDSTRHDHGRDHVRVMEILCAYIRHNAPAKDAQDHPYGEWEPLKDDPTPEERAAHVARRAERFGDGGQVRKWAQSLDPPRADIAEALKVLGRRNRDQLLVEAAWPNPPTPDTKWSFDNAPHLPEVSSGAQITPEEMFEFRIRVIEWNDAVEKYPGHRLDLRGTNLQGADLSNGCFQGARLDGARMEGANLRLSRLQGTSIWQARLEGADLKDSMIQGTNLVGIRAEGASLGGACMDGANLSSARLDGAFLGWAQMNGASLQGVRMERAIAYHAQMKGATLGGARMEGAALSGVQMQGAELGGARFDASTSFLDAEFLNASWKDVDLSMLDLTQVQIDWTFGDGSVILPEGLTRPAHWPTEALDDETYHTQLARWRANSTH